MDSIALKGLRFRGLHGVYEHEQKEGNDFELDLIFYLSLQQAGQTDCLEDTIDYQKAYRITKEIMEGPSVKLIEHLAYRIGNALYEQFPCHELHLRLRKLSPPIAHATINYAEVTMTWPR